MPYTSTDPDAQQYGVTYPDDYLESVANWLNDVEPYDEPLMRKFEEALKPQVPESFKEQFRIGVYVEIGIHSQGYQP